MDNKIYEGIGAVLVAISPADAEVVMVEAEISPGEDHCNLLFDYLGPSGKKQWFLPSSAKVDNDLLDLFVRLRNFFESNGLYAGGRPWKSCIVELCLRSMKIKIDFKYE
ncbi:hypothetical protein [Pseudoxanthomonas composti]|uniref:Uncharacterized protein n=1 Tax=Pseudoxanthomonas composti TaxID=2137479 RepID=A0A4V1N1K9_9GAMM|nr:hypothetical protein [Pseudoxanthomonas composti]RXR08658.1 hypothetical protein EPA99_02235 [Pseudoxanthomonas composti]